MRPVIKRTKKIVVFPICKTYVVGHKIVKVITRIPTCISYYLMNGVLVFLGHASEQPSKSMPRWIIDSVFQQEKVTIQALLKGTRDNLFQSLYIVGRVWLR